MLKLFYRTLLIMLVSGIGWLPNGVAQQYNFLYYSIQDGLAQSQVQTMFQDQDGYLWVGSLGGASRFDGREFINYSTDNGLVNNIVIAIIQDHENNLWFGGTGGITRFNGTAFTPYAFPEELSHIKVNAIIEDHDNRLWLGTDKGGIALFEEGEFTFYNTTHGLPSNNIRCVMQRANGSMLLATPKGVIQFNNGTFQPLTIAVGDENLTQFSVSDIIEDRNGTLWISTYGDGLLSYANDAIVQYNRNDVTTENKIVSESIRSLFEDREGNIWCASKNGISKFSNGVFTNFTTEEGLISDNVRCITEDSEGNIWIGSDGKGIAKFSSEAFVNYTTVDGLSSDLIMSFAEDTSGNLWFSTYGLGVCKYDGTTFTRYDVRNGLSNNTIWTSIVDSNNNIWFGTSEGVSKYDGQKFTQYNKRDSLTNTLVTTIFEDDNGLIWFGTQEGIFNYDGTSFKNISKQYPNIPSNIKIRKITRDQHSNLWFASSNGVYRFSNNVFHRLSVDDGLSHNDVYSIVEDFQGNLWMGTMSGLTYYNGETFKSLKIGDDYSSNFTNFLVFDDSNQLWIGTNKGVYELDLPYYLQEHRIELNHYTLLEGIKGLECNQNAAFKDRKGNLWFGTEGGAVNYIPSKRRATIKSFTPFTQIKALKLFLEETDWSKFADSLSARTGLPQSLSVKHHQNHFTFYYSGISLTNPKKVRYEYQLEGFDEDWLPVTDANFATYSNLPHGVFTFKVRARTYEDNWSQPVAFTFEILPPFWVTWWFYSLCILLGASIGWAIYRWRVNINNRKKATQQLVYKSKMLALEQQTLNSSMNRHFIFNALNSIQYYINRQDKIAANKYLTSFAKLIRKNLDSSQTNMVTLTEELERLELYLTLEHMRFKNKFSYEIAVDSTISTDAVKIPSMLLQPYVENSIWHGILPMEQPGKITVNVASTNGDDLTFTIIDNGIGINTSLENKSKHQQDHISKGMDITSGRINLLQKMTNQNIYINGPLEIKDDNNNSAGTKVEIVLPINAQEILN